MLVCSIKSLPSRTLLPFASRRGTPAAEAAAREAAAADERNLFGAPSAAGLA